MTDELTRAITEATEGRHREGTAKWPECCRDTYSLAIEEIAAALAPLIEARNVHREQQAFDRGYDKAMEGIEARWRSLWEGRWAPHPSPDDYECCASGRCEVCRG